MTTHSQFDPALSQRIAYVRPVAVESLPAELREQAEGMTTVYAIHSADGDQLALVADKALAFALIRHHDREPVSVH